MIWRRMQICDDCWRLEKPNTTAIRVDTKITQTCVQCGKATSSGIYVRRQVDG